MSNAARPSLAQGVQTTRDVVAQLDVGRAAFDEAILKKTVSLSKYRATLLSTLTQSETFLGSELMGCLRAQDETEMLKYYRIKDPRMLVSMLDRCWKVRNTTTIADLEVRATWSRWLAIDPAVQRLMRRLILSS